MKLQHVLVAVLLSISVSSYAQNVGINTDGSVADKSAMLDIKSTAKGMLIPRMTKQQKDSIAAPATGLLVYQTDDSSGFYFNRGTAELPNWQYISTGAAGAQGDKGDKGDKGDAGAPGTDGITSVSGTTDQIIASSSTGDVTLSLPQNISTSSTPTFDGGTFTGTVTASGIGIGTSSPYAALDVRGNIALGDFTTAGDRHIGIVAPSPTAEFSTNSGFSGITLYDPTSELSGSVGISTHDLYHTSAERMLIDKYGNVKLNQVGDGAAGTDSIMTMTGGVITKIPASAYALAGGTSGSTPGVTNLFTSVNNTSGGAGFQSVSLSALNALETEPVYALTLIPAACTVKKLSLYNGTDASVTYTLRLGANPGSMANTALSVTVAPHSFGYKDQDVAVPAGSFLSYGFSGGSSEDYNVFPALSIQ